MIGDFVSRLQPLKEIFPTVIYELIYHYVGNELIPTRTLPHYNYVIGIIGNDVYWVKNEAMMCNDNILYQPVGRWTSRVLYVCENWIFDEERLYNTQYHSSRFLPRGTHYCVLGGCVYFIKTWVYVFNET